MASGNKLHFLLHNINYSLLKSRCCNSLIWLHPQNPPKMMVIDRDAKKTPLCQNISRNKQYCVPWQRNKGNFPWEDTPTVNSKCTVLHEHWPLCELYKTEKQEQQDSHVSHFFAHYQQNLSNCLCKQYRYVEWSTKVGASVSPLQHNKQDLDVE